MKSIFLPGLALLLSLTSTTLAQENQELGRMWTFENPPLAYLEKEYGFKPDQKWLNSLRLGSLRLGGEDVLSGFCSASFVSPKGLIMTNNHCVRDAVASTRAGGPNMIKTGFVAAAMEQEIRLRSSATEWLTVAQLNKISNVTDKVNEGVTSSDNETKTKEKREANKEKILAAAKQADPKLVPQIVSLYQGGIFQLYQYRVYSDLRLVCIPHLQTAHFGGDPDNFTYPRYSIDFAFLRAYEDGKPADTTKHYFKWKSGGAKKNELVFVPGNPGTTNRLFTKAQMEFERDIKIPIIVELLTNRLRIFRQIIRRFPQAEPQFRTQILGWENGQKATRGNVHGLKDAKLMAQKTAAEKAFKGRVMADEKLAAKYGNLWDRIASVVEEQKLHEAPARFHATGNSYLLDAAVSIVRSADPTETEEGRKQAAERLAGLTAQTRGQDLQENVISRPMFEDHVIRARGWLRENDPFFSKVLGGKNGGEFLAGLRGSVVGSAEQRDALVKSGWKAIQESKDPAIVAARELVTLMRKNEKKGEELDAKDEALGAEIGKALFACYGTKVSPDATMTLRFTDGVVKGFPCNGTIAPFRTTFYGLYARNAEFDSEHPFDLPRIWLERESKIDMTKSVNFVSTNDITGGNSGSVVVNKALEVVGLIFDGNIESLHNDFLFKDDVPRSVSVHVDGIMESLLKVYDAHRVAKELTGK